MKKIIKNTVLIFSVFLFLLNVLSVNAIKYIDGKFIKNTQAQRIIASKCYIPRWIEEDKVDDLKIDETRMVFRLEIDGGKFTEITVYAPIIDIRGGTISRISDFTIEPKFELTPLDAVRILNYEHEFLPEQFSCRWSSAGSYYESYALFTEKTGITEENCNGSDYEYEEEEDLCEDEHEVSMCSLKFFEIMPGEKLFVPVEEYIIIPSRRR